MSKVAFDPGHLIIVLVYALWVTNNEMSNKGEGELLALVLTLNLVQRLFPLLKERLVGDPDMWRPDCEINYMSMSLDLSK